MVGGLAGWLDVWMVGWLAGKLAGLLAGWVTSWQAVGPAGVPHAGFLIRWLVACGSLAEAVWVVEAGSCKNANH